VKNNSELADAKIENVQLRDAGGNMATITSGKSVIVAYQGTAGDPEWFDDGDGGKVGVTDTPDQKAALRYFDEMMGTYGSGYDKVITTGHSKGGNLAAYVAMVSGQVDSAVSFDGQGFNQATILKYQEQLAALAERGASITTYASALDFVNLLFGSVSSTTRYTAAPGENRYDGYYTYGPGTVGNFGLYHSPYTLLVMENGGLHLGEASEQHPAMAEAVKLMDYLMKYTTGKDFAVMCDLLMGVKTGSVSAEDILVDGKVSTVEAIWDLVTNGDWDQFKEPYATLLSHLVPLLGGYYQGGGLSEYSQDAIKMLLIELGVLPGWYGAADVAIDPILWLKSDVPYWPQVRDYSESVKLDLLALVDSVTPAGGFFSWLNDWAEDLQLNNPWESLDFSWDKARRNDYYQRTMDVNNTTKKQIEDIFSKVEQEDQQYANFGQEIEELAEDIRRDLIDIEAALQGNKGA